MKSKSGFTLVEMMIIIAVISILASIVTLGFIGEQRRVRDTKRATDIMTLSEEFERYYAANGNYPVTCNVFDPENPLNNIFHCIHGRLNETYSGNMPPNLAPSSLLTDYTNYFPSLGNSFGDPRSDSADRPVNQGIESTVQTTTYFVFSPDLLPNMAGLHSGSFRFFADRAHSSTFQCHFALRPNIKNTTNAKPHRYVMGYFSENTETWHFYTSRDSTEVNPLTWTSLSTPDRCAPTDINQLKTA